MAEDLNDRMTLSLDTEFVSFQSAAGNRIRDGVLSRWVRHEDMSSPKLGGDFIVATFTPPKLIPKTARTHRRLADSRFLNDRCVEGDGLFGQAKRFIRRQQSKIH